jgi:hypothetical protein
MYLKTESAVSNTSTVMERRGQNTIATLTVVILMRYKPYTSYSFFKEQK